MMKKLLFLVLLAFVSIGTWAASSVTVSTDGTTVIVYCEGQDQLTDQLLSANADKFAGEKVIKVQATGTYGQNDFPKLKDYVASNSNIATVDASAAIFTSEWAQKFTDMGNNLKHIILSSNMTNYTNQMFGNLNGLETVTYKNVVATKSGGSFKIQKQASDPSDDEQLLYNILNANNKNPEFIEPAAQTSFEDGVLTLNPNDENAISTWLTNNNVAANSVNKVVFTDGSVWKRDATDAGTLTTTQSPDTHANALTTAGLPVTTTNSVVALGQYVSIINGSIVQIQTNGATDNNITSWPGITADELAAATSATNVKLVGPFTATTFKAVGDYIIPGKTVGSSTTLGIVSLDMSESTGLENTVLGGNIDKTNLQTVILPNTMTDVPAQFAMGCSALTTLSMPNDLKTIGVSAFKNCNNLAYINGGSQGVVSFPTSLEVIGGDAFYGCYAFKEVNLNNLPNLWKVDYAAFNMGNGGEAFSQLTKVNLPSSNNNKLTFFANQVFSSTNVESLDFQYCLGIKHFAYDGANSFNEGTHSGETSNSTETFTYHVALKHITLPPNLLLVAKDCFSHCPELLTATFKGRADYSDECVLINKLNIDDNAFKDCTKMYEVTLSNNLVRIGKRAFDQTALRSVSIPASVEVIEQMAFNENDDLTTVIFEDIDPNCQCGDDPTKKPSGFATVIKGGSVQYVDGNPTTDPNNQEQGAFWNCKAITDVYINNQTQLQCENLAFVFDVTYGHADPNASLATLHFPEKDTDHYANLDHYLTDQIAANPGLFHKWLHEHFQQAIIPKHNGWYEFVNAGPTKGNIDDPKNVCQDIILRTFSDWNYSYLVPEGMRAYIVNKIELNKEGNWEVSLRRLLAIPAKTGVILYGHPNGKNTKGEPVLSMTPISFAQAGQTVINYDEDGNPKEEVASYDHGQALCRANWGLLSTETTQKKPISDFELYRNYLEPTSSPTPADVAKIENKIQSLIDKRKEYSEGSDEYNNLSIQITTATSEKTYLQALMNAHPEWKTGPNGEYKGGRYVKPFENLENDDPFTVVPSETNVAFRNFGLSRYNNTQNLSKARALKSGEDNYEAFFRLKAKYYPTGKAYLHLGSEYTDAYGAEVIVKKNDGDYDEYTNANNQVVKVMKDAYYIEYSKNDGSKIDYREQYNATDHGCNPLGWWVKALGFDWDTVDENFDDGPRMNWGKRPEDFTPNPSLPGKPSNAPRYLGEFGEDADGIVKLVIPANVVNNDVYYTLQGVKVTNPVKGVYIHNGKKVIIK